MCGGRDQLAGSIGLFAATMVNSVIASRTISTTFHTNIAAASNVVIVSHSGTRGASVCLPGQLAVIRG